MHSEIYIRKNNSDYLEQVIKKDVQLCGLKDTASNKEVKKFIKWLKTGEISFICNRSRLWKKTIIDQKFFGADVYVIKVNRQNSSHDKV